jgi:glutathione synthase/RimK-type ligase-like ATP-grasp enzyme
METLVVVTQLKDWSLNLPDVRVVTARSYLMDEEFSNMKRAKVFNLCRHYRYQTYGYYVSLLAEARGHKSIPSVITMQDLRSPAVVRLTVDIIEDKIQKSLAPIQSDKFTLSIYFGRNVAKYHDKLAQALFKVFPAPLLRAHFVKTQHWELQNITAIPASSIPPEHLEFAREAAREFFSKPQLREIRHKTARYDLAILWERDDPTSPSGEKAIAKFTRAAEDLGMAVEIIHREDIGRLAEFDALFIRTTTAVDNYTYRFSSRAAAEGLVVIDDPVSILRCTNKVYLYELLSRNGIPTPKTRIIHRDEMSDIQESIGFPCILKRPDSSSSLGVFKIENTEEFLTKTKELFEFSDLLIVQEFIPTEFDWRIGIIDRRPLFAARYHMAPRHWQILKHDKITGKVSYGHTDVFLTDEAPFDIVRYAVKAANLIGDGFYGVDLKQIGKHVYVIEVNDNPSVDTRFEDRILKDELYRKIMAVFLRRLEERTEGRSFR